MPEDSFMVRNDGSVKGNMNSNHAKILKQYVPKGCPFENYTLYDLLLDQIKMYSWKVKGEISMVDFIRKLQDENYIHAKVYGDTIIDILNV